MRWPWQRERPEPGPERQRPRRSRNSRRHRAPVPPAGWAFLPPLQRTIGTMELAHDPDRFAGALAAWDNPSFTGPMSHLVTADAPPGVIDVDGGGTGTGEAYRSEPADMTLLIPPARSRPAGGLPTAVQRTSSADAPYGASSGARVPDDIGVLHVEAVPTPAEPPMDFQPTERDRPDFSGPRARSRGVRAACPSGREPGGSLRNSREEQAADGPATDASVWHGSAWDTVAPTAARLRGQYLRRKCHLRAAACRSCRPASYGSRAGLAARTHGGAAVLPIRAGSGWGALCRFPNPSSPSGPHLGCRMCRNVSGQRNVFTSPDRPPRPPPPLRSSELAKH